MEKKILETVEHNTVQLGRIAFAMEEILRLVKTDMERSHEASVQYKMEEEQMKKKPEENGRVESWDEKN